MRLIPDLVIMNIITMHAFWIKAIMLVAFILSVIVDFLITENFFFPLSANVKRSD